MDKIGLDRTQATKPGCSHPIPVRMRCADTSTGEIYLGRTIEKDCGSRLAERCLHCSEIYKRDAMSVFNEGVANTETPVTHYTFITFTAPGSQTFGRTHQRVVKKRKANKSHVVRCSCKHTHREDDVRIGTPINPSTYRYDLAAAFNAASSRLLAITLQRLGRARNEKLSYARVAEFQKRGLIHFHVLVKGVIAPEMIREVVLGNVDEEANVLSEPVSHDGWQWGEQVDVKVIDKDDKKQVGYYLLKLISYSLKGTDTSTNGPAAHRAQMQKSALRGCSCKQGRHCALGRRYDPDAHTFYVGKMDDKFCRRHQLAYNGWGFRGHILAFSRGWGMTFKDVRQRRRDYARSFIKQPDTYVVIGWRILPPQYPRITPLRV